MNAVKADRLENAALKTSPEPIAQITAAAAPVAEPAPNHRWRRLLIALGPDLTMLFAFTFVLVVLSMFYHAGIAYRDGSILLAAGALVVILGITFFVGSRATFRTRAKGVIRDWLPFLLLTVVYENLRMYTGVIRSVPIDPSLDALDRQMFGGVSPTLWVQRLYHPLMTDYMSFAYGMYFIMPLAIILLLYWKKRKEDFRELALALVLCFYSGFLLFIIFPAGPPRFYQPMQAIFDPPRLTSYFGLFEASSKAFDSANPNKVYASFPSLHCTIAMLTLVYATRFRDVFQRKWILPAIYAPLVISLWFSTVYLRHHWVVDVFAGWALGFGCASLAPVIRRGFAKMARDLGRDSFA